MIDSNGKDFHEFVSTTLGREIGWLVKDAWDSVENLKLIIAIEKGYGIQFTTEEVRAYRSLEQLMVVIRQKLDIKHRIKVLVLDCDGVLWDGIVGELGYNGVTINESLQEQFVQLERRGYLLCLCSRNNESDVWDVFQKRAAQRLKKSDIVLAEIGWGSKTEAIKRMAAKLSLGLDSFVFMDDSAMERDRVKVELPDVTVVSPDEYWQQYFTNTSTQGSLTSNYKSAMEARENPTPYLSTLNMRAHLYVQEMATFHRCWELSHKTNQFNLTGARIRHTAILGDQYITLCASLQDRFDNHGIVAMMVLDGSDCQVVDFCVSCRALGRDFEYAFLKKCEEEMSIRTGVVRLQLLLQYRASGKNQQCEEFVKRVNARQIPQVPVEWY